MWLERAYLFTEGDFQLLMTPVAFISLTFRNILVYSRLREFAVTCPARGTPTRWTYNTYTWLIGGLASCLSKIIRFQIERWMASSTGRSHPPTWSIQARVKSAIHESGNCSLSSLLQAGKNSSATDQVKVQCTTNLHSFLVFLPHHQFPPPATNWRNRLPEGRNADRANEVYRSAKV